jgi:hypothetical protein
MMLEELSGAQHFSTLSTEKDSCCCWQGGRGSSICCQDLGAPTACMDVPSPSQHPVNIYWRAVRLSSRLSKVSSDHAAVSRLESCLRTNHYQRLHLTNLDELYRRTSQFSLAGHSCQVAGPSVHAVDSELLGLDGCFYMAVASLMI